MSSQRASFDLSSYSLDAIQRAAYRMSDRTSCEILVEEGAVEVVLTPLGNADAAGMVAELRNEVLDQVLRERIREETRDVRNLVLALAFSRTGLIEGDE
jgi:His-Xaa-Ser system protein HxsD